MSTKKKGPPEVVVTTPEDEDALSPLHRPKRPQFVLPSINLELTISAQNLVDRDKLSRSDPICVVYITKPHRKHWVEYARTEVQENTFNPQWNTKVQMTYNFEERQSLMFKIYDWDKESQAWKDHDFLGMLDCSLAEIVSAPNKKFIHKLAVPHLIMGQETPSTITIVVEEVSERQTKEVVRFRFSATNLINRGMLSKHDPYLVIYKQLEDGTWSVVHKTEMIENTRNPNWRYFSVRKSTFGGNRENRYSVFYWSHHGPPKLVGDFFATFDQVMQAFHEGKTSHPLINNKKKEKHKGYKDSGNLVIHELRVEEKKSFIDYLQSGVQLSFSVVIDFSSHNKNLKSPTSYHYLDEDNNNRYVTAIKAVGDVLQDYDYNKQFPAFMYGCKPNPPKKDAVGVHQYFPLNYNLENPACDGVDGILKAYYEALKKVSISTPAIFSESIKQTAKVAKEDQSGRKYCVLLIITRGIINDKTDTIDAIIAASGLPMSIIIICVGDNNFESMQELDSDGRLLQLNGKKAQRDIVQAVDFKKFMSATRDQKGNKVPFVRKRALAAEVLAELPYQVVNWLECFRPTEG